jgi:hypothetical protein
VIFYLFIYLFNYFTIDEFVYFIVDVFTHLISIFWGLWAYGDGLGDCVSFLGEIMTFFAFACRAEGHGYG